MPKIPKKTPPAPREDPSPLDPPLGPDAGSEGHPDNDPDGEARAESHGAPVSIEDEELVGLDDASSENHYFGLWYGIQGTTKTTSIARILLARPVGDLIVCNAEGGLKLQALRRWGIPTERIKIWPKPGIRPTFDSLERLVIKVEAELADARREGRPKPFCAFGVDSVTELVKLMLDNVSEDQIAGQREVDRKIRESGAVPPARRNARARFKAERDDYGLVSAQMRSILRKLRYMDLDVLMTALVRRDEDQDTGATMYGPATPPALQQDLLGYADVVIRTERRTAENGQEEVVGYTSPDENHHAKDRFGVLPAETLVPGADRILEFISGEEGVVRSSDQPAPPDPETDLAPADPDPLPEKGEPATPPKRRTRKTAAGGGRIDARTATVVGEGDGSDDEPPF